MSDPYKRSDEDMAYGDYYGTSRAGNQQGGQGQGQGQDRGIIGDTFKKFKSKYDQYSQNQPQQDFGYGNNPSSSTVGSQPYSTPGGGSGYAGGQFQQQQYGGPGQPAYPGAPPPQKPQAKPDFADKMLGGLLGSVTSIGQDVSKIIGGGSHGQRPPQGQGQGQPQGYQQGAQGNVQTQTGSGATEKRFDSTFVGPKPGNDVKWYVDGCSYMWAVSQALESARQTIWILDWWLSPELYLRRPPARNEEWRIDRILQRAANRGVKVNIIVYKEVTQVLTLSSAHTKHALEALSPNIGVFRHPDHLPDAQTTHSSILSSLQGLKLDAAGATKLGSDALKGLYGITDDVILYWAHHEKLCLIDGNIAFMGGLDLCYGRWDTNQHPIADAHPSDLGKIVFPGQDFNNARVMDFSEVNHPFQNKLDRTKSSRMGWSDISICLRGPCVGDLMHHFVDRWNFIYDEKYNVRQDKRYVRLPPFPDHRDNEGPAPVPAKQSGQQQGQSGGQIAPPPQSGGYVPPPWQASHQPTSAAVPAAGLAAASQTYGQGSGQQGQTQQTFPPPPPGPPPAQGQFGQQQPSTYQPQTEHNSGRYDQASQQGSYPQPPSQPQTSHYGETQQQQHTQPQPQQNYAQPPQTQTGYSTQPEPYQSPSTASQHQYDQGQHSTPTSGYPTRQDTQYSYEGQPQRQDSNFTPHTTDASSAQQQYGANPPVPTFSPPPQQPDHSQPIYGQQGSRPATPSGRPVTQLAQQQYAAYSAPPTAADQGPPGSQGPVELGATTSPQYQAYHGAPTARGLDGQGGYDAGYSGERGFDDSYGYDQGSERAFGRKPGTSPSRFDRYKEEARKLKDEGRFLGHDIGKYGTMLDNKLDGRISQFSGGRIGRPIHAAGNMNCQLVRSCTKWSNGTGTEHSVQNAYIELIQKSKHFIYIENQFFITATGDKQKPVKNMIGKALVERIIRAHQEQTPFKIIVNIPSVPAFAGDLIEDAALGTRAIMEFQYSSICRGGHSIMEEVNKAGINPMDYIRFYNLRNYDRLNVTPSMQSGQQQAGVGYDEARKQYENQQLGGTGYGGYGEMGAPPGGPGQPGPQQIYGQQGQTFQPPPQQQGGYGAQQVPASYNQYQQGAQAAPTVKADDWDSVSSCYMLGGQDIRSVPWSGPPDAEFDAFVSEELYIHSKVMIVDDQTVVCGSANLNDRSMLGTHDSEIALVIQDQNMIQSTMAGRPWQASQFGASLRRQLFRKHLGLLRPQDMQAPDDNFMPIGVPNRYEWGTPEDNIVSDPLSDVFQSLWNSRARTNTEVYRKAFRAVPDDNVKDWESYKEFYEYYFKKADAQAGGKDEKLKQSRVEYGHAVHSDFPGGVRELKELLSQVKGTLVEMPLCFLQDVDMAKENLTSFNALTAEVYT